MALYCEITDMSRPHPATIMVHFRMLDDATTPATVLIASATHGFSAVLRDDAGAIVAETNTQRRNRLRGEFDAYVRRLIDGADAANTAFETLRTQAVGYRYPPA